jgi:hypothetical protein
VFHPKAVWVIADFCRSSGLELPDHEADVDIHPNDCLSRACYAELVHELGRDNKTRLSVKRYLSRNEAIGLNPGLGRMNVPTGTPPPKKLQKAGTGPLTSGAGLDWSSARTGISQDTEVEPDDVSF